MRKWIALVESANWREQIRVLIARAKEQHVELEIDAGMDSINLVYIERRGSKNPERGAGGRVLQQLCDLADQNDLEINLHVAGGARGLVRWYELFGFEMDDLQYEGPDDPSQEHENADDDSYGYEVAMSRVPRFLN